MIAIVCNFNLHMIKDIRGFVITVGQEDLDHVRLSINKGRCYWQIGK